MMAYKILNGNELLIQGALEAGFHLYTGYPGSPLADFFNILYEKKKELHEKGIRVVIANSEANAAAMASGAKMAGQNVLVAMKSMGLHVASDALSVGNFANPGISSDGTRSGVVVAVGDDPWSISTSTPADSRFLFKHLHMPFLEPSTPQELKDWIQKALEISQQSSIYTGLLLTTFMAEGGGRVEIKEEKKVSSEPITLDPKEFNLAANVMVPPNSLVADKEMILNRFPRLKKIFEKLNLDDTFGNQKSKIGIISSGAVFETLKQVLEESELIKEIHLYKAASSYPFNENQLIPFLKDIDHLIVVEEKRAFIETEIKDLISKYEIKVNVQGKEFKSAHGHIEGFPAFGGLTYEIIYKKLIQIFDLIDWEKKGEICFAELSTPTKLDITVPRRLPTFCPGCPHRETLSVMKDIRASLADKNINLISHGDVGCYSLSFLEPFKEMHDLSAMGQGGSLGAGADLFTTNPSVVLMGDSTFFHSGLTSISNSVQMGHNITYILLDNDNTAMTGHQVSPRSGESVEGLKRPRQSMLEVSKSLQVSEAIEVNPSDRYFYKNLMLEMVQRPGVKVIVSNKECGLTFHGRKKREERKIFGKGETQKVREFYQINTDACEDCRACVEMTGCPGLSQTQDAYGSKVMIDPQICVSDSYCTKIKACPSFELVKVHNYHPTKYRGVTTSGSFGEIPLPVIPKDLSTIAQGQDFRAIVIGVGGSGVTTISRVIAEAATTMSGRDDLDFKFVDQKGLAQRNGSVTSHLSIYKKGKSQGQVVPMGTSDLVVSPDLLEGSRAVEFLSPTGLLIVDSDYQVPLTILLDRGIDTPNVGPEVFHKELKEKLSDRVLIAPMKAMCFERFQKPVYASAMVLGIAFQAGRLPFELEDMIAALKASVPKVEVEPNLEAFMMGRDWFLNQSKHTTSTDIESDFEILTQSATLAAYPWQSKDRFKNLFISYSKLMVEQFPELNPNHLYRYVHDLIIFDQGKNLGSFYQSAIDLKNLYAGESLASALRTLAKTYWIKDEVFVSHLMSSPMKALSDKEKYSSLGTNFEVQYINRPSFTFQGKKIEFDISPKMWMLKIMRQMRILRVLLPEWHREEKNISNKIKEKLFTNLDLKELKKLESVKGYREYRYKHAELYLGNTNG